MNYRFSGHRTQQSSVIPREDKVQRMNLPYRPYTHRNPSKDIYRSPPRSVVPKRVYVLNFTLVDRWAKSHAMLRDVHESNCKPQQQRNDASICFVDEYDFKEASVVSTLKRRSTVAQTVKPTMIKLQIIQNDRSAVSDDDGRVF